MPCSKCRKFLDTATPHNGENALLLLRKIQYAMRTGRWWQARILLAEAQARQDWRALDLGSWRTTSIMP